MRIGLNLLYLIPGKVGGTETYTRELIPALIKELGIRDTLVLFCSRETAPTFTASRSMKIVTLPVYAKNRLMRLLIEQTILPLSCLFHQVDVLFSLGYSSPWLHHCPAVVTIHDLNWYYHPEDFGLLTRNIWQLLTRLSAHTATHIITDSQASATSIRTVLGVARRRVTAILHGTPTKIKGKNPPHTGAYILTVVAGHPHKNLGTLLKAFALLHKKTPTLELIVCGLRGRADRANQQLIQALKLQKQVKIMGYVSRARLAGLYAHAKVFVFPSAYEGFGYPVVEAMSYRAPVVSSSAFSLSEVVGTGGVCIAPYDSAGFARAIGSLLVSKSKRAALIARGTKRARELKWETTAKQTLKLLGGTVQ